ncbi:MAG TPA: hypothetical protein VNJ53_13235 [Gaiellaceae bacterium]|nr:hypothetical protein [Gaiellaceae bacterium]
MLDGDLVEAVLAGAWRRDSVLHGDEHWRCVAASGLALANHDPAADRLVVFSFGLLHDTRRENEHFDPDHGPRAAAYARELVAAGVLMLAVPQLELLCHAIELHSDGLVSDDPTIAACWDADRLHLPRVGIDPRQDLFSTSLARGREPLARAELLRASPPTWAALLRLL